MGLLDSIERKKTGNTGIDLQFEITNDDAIEQIVEFYRRMYIRGFGFNKRNSSSYSKVWLHDRENDIYFYRQGYVSREITMTDEEEYYYMLIYKKELWSISCRRKIIDESESRIIKFEAVYLPDKVGKVSSNERAVNNIAMQAISVIEDVEKNHEYKQQLETIFAQDSLQDLVWMKKTWYEQIMESDQCRRLKKSQNGNEDEEDSDEIRYELEVVTPAKYAEHFRNMSQYIKGNRVIMPKVCAVNKKNGMGCIKIFKDKKGDQEETDKNIRKIPENPLADYYLFVRKNKKIVIEVIENRNIKSINILKIFIMDDFEMGSDELKNNIIRAMEELAGIEYWMPKVQMPPDIDMRIISSGEILYL